MHIGRLWLRVVELEHELEKARAMAQPPLPEKPKD